MTKRRPFKLVPPRALEREEQAALFAWSRMSERAYPELEHMHSTQNGMAASSIREAVLAKKAGMKPGIPDIFLPVPRGPYHGLFIELKRSGATPSALSENQKKCLAALNEFGYRAVMCAGWESARTVILEYLETTCSQ